MKFLGIILGALLVGSATANETTAPIKAPYKEDSRTLPISSRISKTESAVRDAAVKIQRFDRGGHGSGSLIQYKDMQLVLTAQHVANAIVGTQYIVQHAGERRTGILIYSNEAHDIALLWLQHPWSKSLAMEWNPTDEIAEVGTSITYSGFPASHSLMSYRGRVAGHEIMPDGSTNILLHTYGWFGCSGSAIYNSDKELVGVLWGIDSGNGQPVESMIWVSPIQHLNLNAALRGICYTLENKPRACK
jgi:S1-C subfamily serine protease